MHQLVGTIFEQEGLLPSSIIGKSIQSMPVSDRTIVTKPDSKIEDPLSMKEIIENRLEKGTPPTSKIFLGGGVEFKISGIPHQPAIKCLYCLIILFIAKIGS